MIGSGSLSGCGTQLGFHASTAIDDATLDARTDVRHCRQWCHAAPLGVGEDRNAGKPIP
jgi:hypothetical protein